MKTNRFVRHVISTGGILVVLCGLVGWLSMGTNLTHAQGLPPRPTESPVPTNAPTSPTSRPNQEDSQPTGTPNGRITGTVIDARTGTPAPGIAVVVGNATVTSDNNGNYHRTGLPAGVYTVALALTPGQGIAEQGPAIVAVVDDTAVVQHLLFRSQPAAQPSPAPAASIQPAELPRTGEQDGMRWRWMWLLIGIGMVVAGWATKGLHNRERHQCE